MGRFVHFPAMRYILRWDRIICTFCIIILFNIQAYHSFSTPLFHEHQYFVFRCIEEVEGILILILWYSSLAAHRFLCYWGSDGRGGRDIDGAATEGWTDSIDFSGNYFDKIIVFFFYEYKVYPICLPFNLTWIYFLHIWSTCIISDIIELKNNANWFMALNTYLPRCI